MKDGVDKMEKQAMNKSRIVAALVAGALLVVPFACGATTQASTPAIPRSLAEQRTHLPIQQTTITVWVDETIQRQAYETALIKLFNKMYPQITVNLVNIPDAGYTQKIATAMASGRLPDVWMSIASTDQFASGNFEPLTHYFEADHINPNMWFQPITGERLTYHGTYYGVPRDIGFNFLVYNKELFAAKGVKPPSGNWTINDFVATCKKLVDPKKLIYCTNWGTDAGSFAEWGGPMLWNFGGDLISKNGRNVLGYMNSANTKRAFEWELYLENHNLGIPSSVNSAVGAGNYYGAYASGHVAMNNAALFDLPTVKSVHFKWGILPFPTVPGHPTYTWVDLDSFVMSAKSQHKDEAWAFMKFLSGQAASTLLAEHFNWAPPVVSVWKKTGLDKDPIMGKLFNLRTQKEQVVNYLRSQFFFDCVDPQVENAYSKAQRTRQNIGPLLEKGAKTAQACLDKDYSHLKK